MKKVDFTMFENGHIKTYSFECFSFACSSLGIAFCIDGCKNAAFIDWDELPKELIGFMF